MRCRQEGTLLVATLAIELLSQAAQRLAGSLIGNLGVDLQGDGDLAVAKYPHCYPRMHIQRRQQRGAGTAYAMRSDVADPAVSHRAAKCRVKLRGS